MILIICFYWLLVGAIIYEVLIAKNLRDSINRKYEDLRNVVIDYLKAEGHEACWTNRKALADQIGEGVLGFPYLPPKTEFLAKCNEYYDVLEKGKNGQGKCCGPDRAE